MKVIYVATTVAYKSDKSQGQGPDSQDKGLTLKTYP